MLFTVFHRWLLFINRKLIVLKCFSCIDVDLIGGCKKIPLSTVIHYVEYVQNHLIVIDTFNLSEVKSQTVEYVVCL